MKTVIKKCLWFPHYISWLWRYLRLKLGVNTLKDIKILSIEFCSICNLRCKYCFIEKLDRARYLDIAVYEKLIQEVCENPRYNIKVMEWPISGEFLIYPQYKDVVEITRRYMEKYPSFRPHIILNDNMMLMDEEKIDLILNSGVVKQLICSVDGHDAASFEDMRPPAKFDVLFRNFKTLVRKNRELGSPVFVQVNNGRDERSLHRPLSKEMKEIFSLADYASFWHPKFWNESFNKKEKNFFPAKGFCTFVFNNVTLSASGFVSKCCMDLKGATTYADLRAYSLEEIWHSNVRKKFLSMMFKNKRSELKGCQTCTITDTNNDNRYSSLVRRLKRVHFKWAKKGDLIYQAVR